MEFVIETNEALRITGYEFGMKTGSGGRGTKNDTEAQIRVNSNKLQ